MTQVKYLKRIERQNGKVVWAVRPTAPVRQALKVKYEQYSDRSVALARALQIADDFVAYNKGVAVRLGDPDKSVAALVAKYKTTRFWRSLKETSKESYSRIIDRVLSISLDRQNSTLADMLTANIRPYHADEIYEVMCRDVSCHCATHTIKVLRRIWYIGLRLEMASANPFIRMELPALPSNSERWHKAEVATFIKASETIGRPSIGLLVQMAYDLAQRPVDIRKMRWRNFDGCVFKFKQQKTGAEVTVPAPPQLLDRLTRTSMGSPDDCIVLNEGTGRPYSRRLYNKLAQRIRQIADIRNELKVSTLRHTASTELGDSGCTEDEIRAITGHQSRQVLSTYVQPTKRMAETAMAKRTSRTN